MSLTLYGCQFMQPALPGFEKLIYPRPARHTLGMMGEMTIKQALERAGYLVCRGSIKNGDLRAIERRTGEIIRVEVKTAMQGMDHKWRFLLWKDSRSGYTNYRHSDVLALLAVTNEFVVVPFIVPVDVLGVRSQVVITSHPSRYSGWLSPYRQSGGLQL